MRTDGRTERRMVMKKLIFSFRSFGYAPKNVRMKCISIFVVALSCENQISLFKLTIHDYGKCYLFCRQEITFFARYMQCSNHDWQVTKNFFLHVKLSPHLEEQRLHLKLYFLHDSLRWGET